MLNLVKIWKIKDLMRKYYIIVVKIIVLVVNIIFVGIVVKVFFFVLFRGIVIGINVVVGMIFDVNGIFVIGVILVKVGVWVVVVGLGVVDVLDGFRILFIFNVSNL